MMTIVALAANQFYHSFVQLCRRFSCCAKECLAPSVSTDTFSSSKQAQWNEKDTQVVRARRSFHAALRRQRAYHDDPVRDSSAKKHVHRATRENKQSLAIPARILTRTSDWLRSRENLICHWSPETPAQHPRKAAPLLECSRTLRQLRIGKTE